MFVSPLPPSRRLSLCFALTIFSFAFGGIRSARAQVALNPQTSTPATASRQGKRSDKAPTTEVSLGFFGQFTPTRAPNVTNIIVTPAATYTYNFQTRQGTSSSGGVEATLHQQFRRYIGYNINMGYSRFAEKYADVHTSGSFAADDHHSVGTNFYELGATAVIEGPRTRRLSTSAEAGGAILSFLPTANPSPVPVRFRPALAFGVGINYKLTGNLSARLGYKGLFYESPNLRDLNLYTVTSEPTVSLVYTFGHRLPKALHQTH